MGYMPTYTYYNCEQDGTQDRVVSIADRDNQDCEHCGDPLTRKLNVFKGLTWAPTAGGMR